MENCLQNAERQNNFIFFSFYFSKATDMLKRKWFWMVLILVMPVMSYAQDIDAHSPQPDKNLSKLQKKAEKKKDKRIKKAENSEKKNLQHSMKIQDRETRKRMK